MNQHYDCIILGAGIYGLYSALQLGKKGKQVLVLEFDSEAFSRATYVNQARVHTGYHYPRSYSTALSTANYFNRFVEDYEFCIEKNFQKVYATSTSASWTNREQFIKFCASADIMCDEISPDKYFKSGKCDGAYISSEYTFDALILRDYFLEQIKKFDNVQINYDARISSVETIGEKYIIDIGTKKLETACVINATYASINQIITMFGYEPLPIKYELCELILCETSPSLKDVGITVMDGPFFSIMPFGKTGLHSLSAVHFTPHVDSHETLPTFKCQEESSGYCTQTQLGNCNLCPVKPKSVWEYMSRLARSYLKDEYVFNYVKSLFSMKPILKTSEVDDSRPTVIKAFSKKPTFVSVLSGKINTIYDLDKELDNIV